MSTWNRDTAVAHLVSHAKASSSGWCARYTRQAIEAGGVTLIRKVSAKDYGSSLVAVGFKSVGEISEGFQKGDVAVIQNFTGHKHGHMQMYSGSKWISDFKQRDFWPGSSYRKSEPDYLIYRFPGLTGGVPAPPPALWEQAPYPGKLIKKGMKGSDVKVIQNQLLKKGYDLGRWGADGDFGDATDKAVRDFQKKHGLGVDGKVGRNTWGKLFQAGPIIDYVDTNQNVGIA